MSPQIAVFGNPPVRQEKVEARHYWVWTTAGPYEVTKPADWDRWEITRPGDDGPFTNVPNLAAARATAAGDARKLPVQDAELMSDRVYALEYQHEEDGENYRHDFGPGVEMWALDDGTVLLRHPRKPLWGDF